MEPHAQARLTSGGQARGFLRRRVRAGSTSFMDNELADDTFHVQAIARQGKIRAEKKKSRLRYTIGKSGNQRKT